MRNFLLSLALLLVSICSQAEPIEFIVRAAPGGPDDAFTRKLQDHLEKTTNLKFVVLNKPGAAHTIGYSYFQNTTSPALIIGDVNINKHPVATLSDKLTTLGYFTNILYVRRESGIKNLSDLIDLSKSRPIRFGHGGVGTFSHEAASKLCTSVLSCVEVPYKSGAPGMIDLMGGHIDAYGIVSYGTDYSDNDKLQAILLFSNSRYSRYNLPLLPDSLKHLEIKNWIALYGRNLSQEQKRDIITSINALDKSIFNDSGLLK